MLTDHFSLLLQFVALSLVALVFGEAPLGYDYPKPASTSFGEVPQAPPKVQQTYGAPEPVPEAKFEHVNFQQNFQETYNDNVPAVHVTFPIPETAPVQSFQSAPVQHYEPAPEEDEDYQAIPEKNNFKAAVPAATYESLPVQQAQTFQAQSFQTSQNFQAAPVQTYESAPQQTYQEQSFQSAPVQSFQQSVQSYQEPQPVQNYNYQVSQTESKAQSFPRTYTVTVQHVNGQEVQEEQIENAIVEMMAKYFSQESSASSSGTFSVPATSYGTPDASIPKVHSVYGTPQYH